jgi:hypothetical protein
MTPSQLIAGYGGMCLSSKAMQKNDIGKIVVQAGPGKKVCATPSQRKKKKRERENLAMVAYTCHLLLEA